MLEWILFSIVLFPYFAGAIFLCFLIIEKTSNLFYCPFLKANRRIAQKLRETGLKNQRFVLFISKILTLLAVVMIVILISTMCLFII